MLYAPVKTSEPDSLIILKSSSNLMHKKMFRCSFIAISVGYSKNNTPIHIYAAQHNIKKVRNKQMKWYFLNIQDITGLK